jgi:Zn-dependent protease/CBS domain-containing protein
LARIAGIDVRLDWSLLVVFWLILVNLGAGLFPARHPDWSPLMTWGVAIIAAVLFFLSVLAHELSHAIVGRANGVPVSGITLFIFGGVAIMRREPPSPRAELLMTIVGPLTSLLIGTVAFLLGVRLAAPVVVDAEEPLRAFQAVGPLATVLLWLGPINIVLGLFNLVPGFPLDGGRVLRALLWAWTKDFARATRWAAGVGQAVGMLLIFGGISMMFGIWVPILGTGFIPGLWIVFIGWFLNGAAVASTRQVVIHDLLEGVAVSELMRSHVATVPPDLPVSQLVDDYLMATDQGAFPVTEGARLIGLITLADVQRVPREAWQTQHVRDVMTGASSLVVVAPDQSAAEALTKLAASQVEQLPVVEGGRADGRLLGIVRHRDLGLWLELEPRRGQRPLRERHA